MTDQQDFLRARECCYLDTAAEGLPPAAAAAALEAYLAAKNLGTPGRAALYAEEREAIRSAARLLGVAAEDLAFLANTSEALNLLANSMRWEPGDHVLLCDLEFPSNVVSWLRLRQFGVDVEVLPAHRGAVPIDDFVSRLRPRTRLVTVSQVSYKTGTRLPYVPELAAAAHRVGALLCLDATQALGRVPVAVEGVDYLVASSYKWLLGTHGLAVAYCAPTLRDRMEPASTGWYSLDSPFRPDRFTDYALKPRAAALQAGMPNFPAIYALRAGVDHLLAADVARIDETLRPLVADLREGLAKQGLDLLTPADPVYASGIVSFAHPRPEALGAALEERGVIVWAGDGRVRASMHLYNGRADVERLLDALLEVNHLDRL
ncbi:MAG: aminotransferase class V-fold PLP-dependent enzyme [Bryobacterales bacterium]|nr:aminotransferase class V-fold PLP-dependent enzyme [Bryobacterales bacterium]